ncbi:MAG TPA: leucine-rich repeat domain-containing protein [Chlamydiales bacterium]|nr:leucine-rich repeat domain-containing protein [Chlamydiales bacterium]
MNSTLLKDRIIVISIIAAAALGFVVFGLVGLVIGAIVGMELSKWFFRQFQTDINLPKEIVSVSDQAKKSGILNSKDDEFEVLLPESREIKIQDPRDITEPDLGEGMDEKAQFDNPIISNQTPKIGIVDSEGNELQALLSEPTEIKIQRFTDVIDPILAQDLISFYNQLPIDNKPQFEGSITDQAKSIQAWFQESPEVLTQESLDLSNLQLTKLPSEIGLFVHLKELKLQFNKLQSLPPEIGNLCSLTTLNLAFNQIRALPPEISNLRSLTTLSLFYNPIETFPLQILNLGSLEKLTLGNNLFEGFSALTWICEISSLTDLSVSHMRLEALPPEIIQLKSLRDLDLSHNSFKEIPASLANLPCLKKLSLNQSLLYYPEEFANFKYYGYGIYKNLRAELDLLHRIIETTES